MPPTTPPRTTHHPPPTTIIAIATPIGRGGLGIVRLSGPRARPIGEALVGAPLLPRQARFAHFRDTDGALLDEVIALFFPSPHSATTEDVVEITAHGAPVLLDALLQAALGHGAQLAEPGEFTRRAFLHGRLDLTQAEAVRDLIDSHTLFQARTAARQMQGSVARALHPLHQRFVALIARLEAAIDFADDDVSIPATPRLLAEMEPLHRELSALEASYRHGRTVRDGLVLAILGRPNVGKSSLFNRLLARDRAIVTPQPGTTRDLIAESMDWDGIPVRLLDTAGIRAPEGEAERLGIQKSWEAAADADLVLAVFDGSQPLTLEDRELLGRVADLPQALLVSNKHDLPPAVALDPAAYPVSALTGAGIPALRAAVHARALPELAGQAEFLTNARHAQHVAAARASLESAQAALAAALPHEVVLVDLYEGLRSLDAITGQTTVEDILGVIFSTFCIGK